MQRLALLFLCFFTLTIFVSATPEENDGVLGKIKAGLQYATNYLETAKDIADLVSKSLGHREKEKRGEVNDENPSQTFGPANFVPAFFRLLGLDSQKVMAIAVNSVIFLAQLISTMFELKPPAENIGRNFDDDEPSWNPAQFILESKNERIQNLMKQAQDQDLPNQLIERVDGFDSACIRLLLCKSSPIIRAAQNSLLNRTRDKSRHITAWLPSKDEFEENSDECEEKHTDCSIFPES